MKLFLTFILTFSVLSSVAQIPYVTSKNGRGTNLTIANNLTADAILSTNIVTGSLSVSNAGNNPSLHITGNPGIGGFDDVITSDPSALSISLGGGRAVKAQKFQALGVPGVSGDGSGLTGLNVTASEVGPLPYVSNSFGLGTNTTLQSPIVAGTYQNTPSFNSIQGGPINRNDGAAYSGIYSEQHGGSGSALSDLPSNGNQIWDSMRKPCFIISTRQTSATFNNLQ